MMRKSMKCTHNFSRFSNNLHPQIENYYKTMIFIPGNFSLKSTCEVIRMFRASSLLLIVGSIGLAANITDYCYQSGQLCSNTGYQHVTCGASGDLGPTCPSDANAIDLSDANIQQILDLHNKYRNTLAGGNLSGFNSAAKMNTLVC
jgi:hypothetical protein